MSSSHRDSSNLVCRVFLHTNLQGLAPLYLFGSRGRVMSQCESRVRSSSINSSTWLRIYSAQAHHTTASVQIGEGNSAALVQKLPVHQSRPIVTSTSVRQGEATQLDMTIPPPCRNGTLHTFTKFEQKIKFRNLLERFWKSYSLPSGVFWRSLR